MKIVFIFFLAGLLSLPSWGQYKRDSAGKLDMSQFQYATPEQIASKRVDFTEADMRLMQSVLTAASRILTKQSTIEKEKPILGEPDYFVPKTANQEIRSVGFEVGYLTRFPPENDWDPPALFKEFGVDFVREKTLSPWVNFKISIGQPYEYIVYVPISKAFLDEVGLVLTKTKEDRNCQNFIGKCNAFIFTSKLYPGLIYTFLTDPDRSDLKSRLPTNFRTLNVEVVK